MSPGSVVWLGGEGLNEGVLGQEGPWLCRLCLSQFFPPVAWSPEKVPLPPSAPLAAPLAEGPCLREGLLRQGIDPQGWGLAMDGSRQSAPAADLQLLPETSCPRRVPWGWRWARGGSRQSTEWGEEPCAGCAWRVYPGGCAKCSPPQSLLWGARLKPQML